MKIIKLRCIKDGYNITKGKIYTLETLDWDKVEYILNKSGVKIIDDKGGIRHYLTEFFIDVEDKQTWRELQLKELI